MDDCGEVVDNKADVADGEDPDRAAEKATLTLTLTLTLTIILTLTLALALTLTLTLILTLIGELLQWAIRA
jgi:accessory gene regulator protein AgrB